MEALLAHPKVVHIPIALAVLMPAVAGGLALAWWRAWLPRRTWLVAAALQLVLVGSSFVAMETGEADEERAERVVPEAAIETHEEAAEVFAWGAAAVLALFAGAALVRRERLALALAGVSVLGSVVVLGLGYRVGEAGGALVYRYGAARAYIDASGPGDARPTVAPREHGDEDDDD